jgi:hypothetical protein
MSKTLRGGALVSSGIQLDEHRHAGMVHGVFVPKNDEDKKRRASIHRQASMPALA